MPNILDIITDILNPSKNQQIYQGSERMGAVQNRPVPEIPSTPTPGSRMPDNVASIMSAILGTAGDVGRGAAGAVESGVTAIPNKLSQFQQANAAPGTSIIPGRIGIPSLSFGGFQPSPGLSQAEAAPSPVSRGPTPGQPADIRGRTTLGDTKALPAIKDKGKGGIPPQIWQMILQMAIPAIAAGIGTSNKKLLPGAAGFATGYAGSQRRRREAATKKEIAGVKEEKELRKEARRLAIASFAVGEYGQREKITPAALKRMEDLFYKMLTGEAPSSPGSPQGVGSSTQLTKPTKVDQADWDTLNDENKKIIYEKFNK